MKKLQKVYALVLVMAVILCAISGCSSGSGSGNDSSKSGRVTEKIIVKVSMTESSESLDYQRCVAFTEAVNAKCGNVFDFQIYPNGALGDFTDVNVECIDGTVEMIYGGLSPAVNPLAGVTIIPYLCTSLEDALDVFSDDGFAYELTEQCCEEEGLHFLGFDVNGTCGLALKGKAPENPLSANGGNKLQIRVPGDVRQRALMSDLGYIPTSVDWSEVYSSVQTNVINGFIGATALTAEAQFSDVIDYYYDINLFTSVNTIVVSNVFWDKLTEEQKAAFDECGGSMLENSVRDYQNAVSEAYEKLEAAGVTVVIPSDEELQALADMCRAHWDTLKDDYGEEFYAQIAAAYGL